MKKLFILIFIMQTGIYAIAQQTFDCVASNTQTFLEINKVRARIVNNGMLWFDGSNLPGYEVPKVEPFGSSPSKHLFFVGSIWLGGIADNGQLKTAAMTYAQDGNDFWTGPIENGETNQEICDAWNDVFELSYDEVYNLYSEGTVTENLLKYPAKNNPHLINEIGASLPENEDFFPFYDVNFDGIYNPNDGDYPNITGDQSLHWIMNDIGNEHLQTNGQALGFEIKCTAYAYDQFGLDTTTFYRYEITNKSNERINDFIFGFRADPDIGNAQDDFVGVDTLSNIAYSYNGDNMDEVGAGAGYGTVIPLAGIVLLDVPYQVHDNESKLGSFVYYNNDLSTIGNPENAPDYYSYLNAKWKNDQPITYGENGANPNNEPTKFMYPSAPNDTSLNAWSECSEQNTPSDRRFLMAAKPITLEVGQIVKYELAVVTTFNVSYPCPDITGLQESVEYVQAYYDNYIKAQLLSTDLDKENVITNEVRIFPNPVTDFIEIKSDEEFVKAEIFDLQGKIILSLIKVENNFIDLSSHKLNKGNYILKLFNNENKIVVKKISIN